MRTFDHRWGTQATLGWVVVWLAAASARAAEPPEDRPPPAVPPGVEVQPPDDELPPLPSEPPGMTLPKQGPGRPEPPPFFDRPPDMGRLREFLEEFFPEQAEDLRILERFNRRRFQRRMREIMPRILRLMRELERDEELGLLGIEEERLELQIHRAVRVYFDTSDQAERQEIRARIEEAIAQQFDIRQRRSERTIHKLERRLERLKRHVVQRAEKRDELIARELEMRLESPEPPLRPRGQDRHQRPGGPPARRGGR